MTGLAQTVGRKSLRRVIVSPRLLQCMSLVTKVAASLCLAIDDANTQMLFDKASEGTVSATCINLVTLL